MKKLLASNRTITQAAVATSDGRVLYQTNNWDVSKDIKKVIAGWQMTVPFIVLCDNRYSVLQCTPERLVTTNVGKKGHVVGALTPEGHVLITHTSNDGNYQASYMDTARAADLMKPGGVIPKNEIKGFAIAKVNMDLENSKVAVTNYNKEEKNSVTKKYKDKEPIPKTDRDKKPIPKTEKGKKAVPKTEKGKKPVPKTDRDKIREILGRGKEQVVQTSAGASLFQSLLVSKQDTPLNGSTTSSSIDPMVYQEIQNFLTWIQNPVGLAAHIDYALWHSDYDKIAKLANVYRKMCTIFNIPR